MFGQLGGGDALFQRSQDGGVVDRARRLIGEGKIQPLEEQRKQFAVKVETERTEHLLEIVATNLSVVLEIQLGQGFLQIGEPVGKLVQNPQLDLFRRQIAVHG